MCGDDGEDYLEGRERMDLIKTAQPQWKNLNVSDTGRLDEFFDHAGIGIYAHLSNATLSLVLIMEMLSKLETIRSLPCLLAKSWKEKE